MPKGWSGDDEDILIDQFDDMMMREELSGRYDVTMKAVSEKLEHLSKKAGKKHGVKDVPDDPFLKFGYIIRSFILTNINSVDYRDIAALAGISADELKEAMDAVGIEANNKKIKRWADIDFKKFKSTEDCARCDVQRLHSAFSVGYTDCKHCVEENIHLWICTGHPIRIALRLDE